MKRFKSYIKEAKTEKILGTRMLVDPTAKELKSFMENIAKSWNKTNSDETEYIGRGLSVDFGDGNQTYFWWDAAEQTHSAVLKELRVGLGKFKPFEIHLEPNGEYVITTRRDGELPDPSFKQVFRIHQQ